MVHVSASCNPNFHATGAHYINADTTAFMQFLTADLFKDFPTLRFIIPHGGGAVPVPLGPLPRPRAGHEAAAARRPDSQQRVLRHLRLSPGRHRPAAEDRAGRQHPVRIGDGRRRARHRSRDRALLRRHQALRRRSARSASADDSRRSSRATRARSIRGSTSARQPRRSSCRRAREP